MTKCCAVAVALFGGYFLAAYLINQAAVRFCAMGDNLSLVQQFSGYAMVVVFLLRMVLGILPDFQIIAMLLQFYTVYVAATASGVGCQPPAFHPDGFRAAHRLSDADRMDL